MDRDFGDFFGFVFLMVVCGVGSCSMSNRITREYYREEAVRRGAAEWHTAPNGDTKFEWTAPVLPKYEVTPEKPATDVPATKRLRPPPIQQDAGNCSMDDWQGCN